MRLPRGDEPGSSVKRGRGRIVRKNKVGRRVLHHVRLGGFTVPLLFLLSSCGGGDSNSAGGSSPPPVTVPTPGGATPPPPNPSPVPSPTYETITDFSRARSFSDFGVRLETVTSGGQTQTISSMLQENLGEVGFNFTVNPRSYSVFYEREAQTFTMLSPIAGDITGELEDRFTDSPINNLYQIFSRFNRNGHDYVGEAGWSNTVTSFPGSGRSDREIKRLFIYGSSTIPTDLPNDRAYIYRFSFVVFNPTRVLQASMQLTVDWRTGQMVGKGFLPCGEPCPTPPADGDVQISAQVSGSRFQGTIVGPNGASGRIVGRFYGPRGIEIGAVMRLAGGGMDESIGSFAARADGL